jgi:predicted ArsR family transcriptional regulator
MFREIPLYIVVMFLEIYQLCIYICPLSHVQRDFSIYCSNVSKDLQALYLHFACVITATFLKEKRYIILTKWPFQVVLS